MIKEKFYKLVDVLNYYDVQRDFLVLKDGHFESVNFDDLLANNIPENELPYDYKDFKKYGIKLDGIGAWCNDSGEVITYLFDGKGGDISVHADDKFTMKEAITIINLVMEWQRLNKRYCHKVGIGRNIDEEITVYGQDSTAYGLWWNDFIELFQKNIDDIETINIYYFEDGDAHRLSIILEMKKTE